MTIIAAAQLLVSKDGEWRVVHPSKYARRITGQTPIAIGGPAAGDRRLMHQR